MKTSHELETAIRAAKTAGEIQLKYFGKPLEKTMKGPKDFVTKVDIECEKAILSILQKEFPDYGILSEERGKIEGNSDYRWIVDPLDGTIWYANGLPSFGVLITLEKNLETQLGIVFQPAQSEMLVAQKNKGTELNGQRVRASKRKKIEEALRLDSEIMKNLPEGTHIVRSRDGIIVNYNPRFAQMFGYEPGELLGRHVSIVNAPTQKTPEETAREIGEYLYKHKVWRGEIYNIKYGS